MSQTGFTPILIYGSTTTGNTPSASNLTTSSNGVELAINATDGKLFYKDNGGTVQVLATKGTGTIGGSNTQVQYNSSGALAGSSNLTFDGTTLTANTLSVSTSTTTPIVQSSGSLLLKTNGTTTAVTIDTSQNVGIGSSPSTKLTVYDATTPQVTFNNGTSTFIVGNNSGGNNKILYGTGAYPMIFYTNATEAMRIDASQNLGLGVTPSAWISTFKAIQIGNGASVQGQTNSVSIVHVSGNAYVDSGGTYRYIGTGEAAQRYQQYSGAHSWYTAASGTAGNAITFTQALTLDSGGSLLIGDTSAPTNGLTSAALSTKGQGTGGSRRSTASAMGITSSLAQNATANTYSFGGYGGYGLFVAEGGDPNAAWRAAAIVWSTGAALTILNLGSSNIVVGSSGTTVTVQNTNASAQAIAWSMLVLG